jgi:hypothetical protein
MIAGAVLVMLGFVGQLVFRQRDDAEAEIKETANGNEQWRSNMQFIFDLIWDQSRSR